MTGVQPRQMIILLANIMLIGIGLLALTGSVSLRPILFAVILFGVAMVAYFFGKSDWQFLASERGS